MLILDENTVLQADPQAIESLLCGDGDAVFRFGDADLGQQLPGSFPELGFQIRYIQLLHRVTSSVFI